MLENISKILFLELKLSTTLCITITIYFTGNTFIVNVALADLLITSILMPCSTIVLLAGMDETLSVCRVQWFFAACAFVITVLSLAVSILM